MKRSKIFLGITTCILAVAAFAAKKSFLPATIPVYTTGARGDCTAYLGQLGTPTISPANQIGYSFNALTQCSHALYSPEE